jgi:ribosomal protein L24
MTNDYYGFTSTDDVKYDAQGLPLGEHKVMIIGEEPDSKERGLVAEFEIVEGEHKGKRGKVWFLTKHENTTTSNIAKQNIKRIADATGRAVTPTSPLKGRLLRVLVGVQKNDADRTEIKKYLPADKDDQPF